MLEFLNYSIANLPIDGSILGWINQWLENSKAINTKAVNTKFSTSTYKEVYWQVF